MLKPLNFKWFDNCKFLISSINRYQEIKKDISLIRHKILLCKGGLKNCNFLIIQFSKKLYNNEVTMSIDKRTMFEHQRSEIIYD